MDRAAKIPCSDRNYSRRNKFAGSCVQSYPQGSQNLGLSIHNRQGAGSTPARRTKI